jgi:uncharacterized protein (DUF433 family)
MVISPENPWFAFVESDPERRGGEPVFRGTRVPISAFFDYLRSGHDISTFLEHFPTVRREQAVGFLSVLQREALTGQRAA